MKALLKRSTVKQLTCFILSVMIIVGFVPLPARAATEKYIYKTISLSQNKWITPKDGSYNKKTNTYTVYLYKINIPANSYIRVDSKDYGTLFQIYKSFDWKKPLEDIRVFEILNEINTYYRVMPKGTYYIFVDGDAKFKLQCFTTKNPTNFCKARASQLKAGYKKTEVFNYKYEFDRWYKISLTKRKPIYVTTDMMDYLSSYDFLIYNSKGQKVSCKGTNSEYYGIHNYKTAVLPKGTYYIRVYRDQGYFDDKFINGRIFQFWWR